MRVTVLAVTGKQPSWLAEAVDEYARRLRGTIRLDVVDLKAESRSRGRPVEAILKTEAASIAGRLVPTSTMIALDERGETQTTEQLSGEIAAWRQTGTHVTFVIGGPDGLDVEFKSGAQRLWALSRMTLPHGLAKLLLVEQLYRACSILDGHPYHRA